MNKIDMYQSFLHQYVCIDCIFSVVCSIYLRVFAYLFYIVLAVVAASTTCEALLSAAAVSFFSFDCDFSACSSSASAVQARTYSTISSTCVSASAGLASI